MALHQSLYTLIWACALLPARIQCEIVDITWSREGVEIYTPESPLYIRQNDLLSFQCVDDSQSASVYFFREDIFSEAFRSGCNASSEVPVPYCPSTSFAGCGITHEAVGQPNLAESCVNSNFLPGGTYYLADINNTEDEVICHFALPLRVCSDTDPPECGRSVSPSTVAITGSSTVVTPTISPSQPSTILPSSSSYTSCSSNVIPTMAPSSSPMCCRPHYYLMLLLATILTAAFITCVF